MLTTCLYLESSHQLISRKEFGQLCMYHLHVSPCPPCLMVILIEFPIETESPLVLWEDCTPKMSARYYSELWCGGEVAQAQSIQQTGFLGIRRGVKKTICAAVGLRCLFPLWFLLSHTQAHTWKSLWHCALLKAQTATMTFFFTLHSFKVLTVICWAKWTGRETPRSPSSPLSSPHQQPVRPPSSDGSASLLYCLVPVLTQLIFFSQIRADY